MFFTILGCWVGMGGGSPQGLVHNLLMQFFTLDSCKIEVFKLFFLILRPPKMDHPCYVKHVSGHIWVFFTILGCWVGVGWGAPKGLVHILLMQFFTLDSSKIEVFKTCLSDEVTT